MNDDDLAVLTAHVVKVEVEHSFHDVVVEDDDDAAVAAAAGQEEGGNQS